MDNPKEFLEKHNNKDAHAFPVNEYHDSNGLSKREYAAIHIMAALAVKYPYDRLCLAEDTIFLVDGLFDRLEK